MEHNGQHTDQFLAKYLHTRDLKPALEIDRDLKDEVLSDDGLLGKIAGLVDTYGPALHALIQLRTQALVRELVERAYPVETIILRQAMVEIGAIEDDAREFSEEWKRRKAEKEGEDGKQVSEL